jgi:hypothetical protein
MLLAGKVCVIVAVSSERGIGFATAQLFCEQGAVVTAVDIQMDEDRIDVLNRAFIRKSASRSFETIMLKQWRRSRFIFKLSRAGFSSGRPDSQSPAAISIKAATTASSYSGCS